MNTFTILYKNTQNNVTIPNEIHINTTSISFYELYLVITDSNERKRLVEDGIELWRKYIANG
jgi:hypothetical protein